MAHATLNDDVLASRYGNRFLLEAAPSTTFPETGMEALEAMRLVALQHRWLSSRSSSHTWSTPG
jgi:hypothetical protein